MQFINHACILGKKFEKFYQRRYSKKIFLWRHCFTRPTKLKITFFSVPHEENALWNGTTQIVWCQLSFHHSPFWPLRDKWFILLWSKITFVIHNKSLYPDEKYLSTIKVEKMTKIIFFLFFGQNAHAYNKCIFSRTRLVFRFQNIHRSKDFCSCFLMILHFGILLSHMKKYSMSKVSIL